MDCSAQLTLDLAPLLALSLDFLEAVSLSSEISPLEEPLVLLPGFMAPFILLIAWALGRGAKMSLYSDVVVSGREKTEPSISGGPDATLGVVDDCFF